jgi:hypothetical protein
MDRYTTAGSHPLCVSLKAAPIYRNSTRLSEKLILGRRHYILLADAIG